MYPDDELEECQQCECYESCLNGEIYMCPYGVEP